MVLPNVLVFPPYLGSDNNEAGWLVATPPFDYADRGPLGLETHVVY